MRGICFYPLDGWVAEFNLPIEFFLFIKVCNVDVPTSDPMTCQYVIPEAHCCHYFHVDTLCSLHSSSTLIIALR